MSSDVNDFLFSGGARAFPFENVGDIVKGTVIRADVKQQTAIDSGELLTWPDGRPRMQLVVELQTDLHESDEDDGVRTIFAKGGRYEIASGEGMSMKDAIADAVKAAKADGINPGDELAVGYTGVGKPTQRGYTAPKLYAASFRPASKSVKAADLFGDETPIDTGV
jgi:hypothetical protein